jgi:hypothetical protein
MPAAILLSKWPAAREDLIVQGLLMCLLTGVESKSPESSWLRGVVVCLYGFLFKVSMAATEGLVGLA